MYTDEKRWRSWVPEFKGTNGRFLVTDEVWVNTTPFGQLWWYLASREAKSVR